ncbi:hypothetical protein PHYPSEUDO_003915 [Phytophthora pseudosyringae]|uniref:Uncharacterized protein n=1 Tax=Phytophthora pseudosyringae TaxID=221518 RepID=A0A8T1VPE8_9STRA|nr:hypothetical protein PHYPSEUDO_003915 [Phytophthora pseudosyringae]
MGRRGVEQLTAAQWREALEQQIREKEQQQQQRHQRFAGGNAEEEAQRRSQSAPEQQGEGSVELIPGVPGLERAVTTSTCTGETEDGHLAGRRRRVQQLQSREDYLKGLQEQIAEKRLAQEVQEREKPRRRRVSRSEADDVAVARRDSCGGEERQPESKSGEGKGSAMPESVVQDKLEDAKPTAWSNQHEAESWQAPVLRSEVAADPVAITKIVDFCEELKKQNEDVKKQLLEQHAVLASLHSTLAVKADATTNAAGSRRRDSVRRGSVNKSQTEARPRDSLTTFSSKVSRPKIAEAKLTGVLPVVPRPRPTRGETKIPLPRNRTASSLLSAGAAIVKGFSEEVATESRSPLQRAEEKVEPFARTDTISAEKKALPPASPSKSLAKEEHTPFSETKTGFSETQDCPKSQDPESAVPKSGGKEGDQTTSSAKEVGAKNPSDFASIGDSQVIQPDSIDDEYPMDTESKFVHDWESASTGDELLDCTSISILDGPSSLISLDQPLADIFQ